MPTFELVYGPHGAYCPSCRMLMPFEQSSGIAHGEQIVACHGCGRAFRVELPTVHAREVDFEWFEQKAEAR